MRAREGEMERVCERGGMRLREGGRDPERRRLVVVVGVWWDVSHRELW